MTNPSLTPLLQSKSQPTNYWYPPALASDRNVLVISGKKEQLAPANFNDHYQQLGEIGEITLTKQGKKAGCYYYRQLT